MDPSFEIRKLPPNVIKNLVHTLEYAEYWKRLMSIIPNRLEKNNYECKVTIHNLPKYKSEHFRLIENESRKSNKPCTEILLDEWSTSARVRPALGHLLDLLKRAELFRAADYVAVDLLHQDPPERPEDGPAALIADLPKGDNRPGQQAVEKLLNQIEYESSLINHVNDPMLDTNIDNRNSEAEAVREKPKVLVIPEIVISESRDEGNGSFNVPLVVPRERNSGVSDSNNENVPQQSNGEDLCNEEQVPQLSKLLGEASDEIRPMSSQPSPNAGLNSTTSQSLESMDISSASDMIWFSSTTNSHNNKNSSVVGEEGLPNLTIFNIDDDVDQETNGPLSDENSSDNVPQISALMRNSDNVPHISALLANGCDSNNTSQVQNDAYLPVISALNENSLDSSRSISTDISLGKMERRDSSEPSDNRRPSLNTQFSHFSNISRIASRTVCVSPLPNLSLNTILKHFSYGELEAATDNFDGTPHINSLERENSQEQSNGRFLGSGAFGSVFLALDLLDTPVAVKRLHLNNPDVVDVDDAVTKQFKNEVEVLCKYKHENLVSLVGYSCDGPTYCLMYEYMSGGALKDRLQNQKHRLPWQDRLRIALGTAKAVAYLHTAFATPLIHRDIKSANILLDCYNKPKLCDFGLIKMAHSQHTNTSTTVSGTSAYMAPEVFRGDVSVKMDTFSFGVVLLELLTALPTFDPDREGRDLVTYIEENCDEGTIDHLLDQNAGTWISKDKNFGNSLFHIATRCLEEKRRRPEMADVTPLLAELGNDI